MTSPKDSFYQRQTQIPLIGEEGQQLLADKSVLILGAGGLGHPVSTYLAAAGVGKIHLVDNDKVEESNLNRQVQFTFKDVGHYKALVLAEVLKKQNPFIRVSFTVNRLGLNNGIELLQDYDVIVDCTDNLETKFLVHDLCLLLQKDLIQGSIYQLEGQIHSFPFSKQTESCLRCLWDKIPAGVQNCNGAGVVGVTAGIIGTMCASESLKRLLELNTLAKMQTLTFNLLEFEINKLSWAKKADCSLCTNVNLKTIKQLNTFEYEVHGLEDTDAEYIDIREEHELSTRNNKFSFQNLPLSKKEQWKSKLNKEKKYVFICQSGRRSKTLVEDLRNENFLKTYSFKGGMNENRQNL